MDFFFFILTEKEKKRFKNRISDSGSEKQGERKGKKKGGGELTCYIRRA
jgi:hypothetical protein